MDYPSAVEYLYSRIDYEKKLPTSTCSWKTERIDELLRLLGNPHQALKVVHVAGTKGKGSVCAFLSSILKHAGYKVGLFTSPHLIDFRERMRILSLERAIGESNELFDGLIPRETFGSLIERLQPVVKAVSRDERYGMVSFFECCFAVSVLWFYETGVDIAVLETGLGGRLDATNRCDAKVNIITPISYEHTALLGDTLEAIAYEKAAIIKPGACVINAPQTPEVAGVIMRCAAEQCAQLVQAGTDIIISDTGKCFTVATSQGSYEELQITLLGSHQRVNAALAIAAGEAVNVYGLKVDHNAIRQGVQTAVWPGRFEIISHAPTIICDGAQNPASCRVARTALDECLNQHSGFCTIIFGTSSDKDHQGMLEVLYTGKEKLFITQADAPRARSAHDIAATMSDLSSDYRVFNSSGEALKVACAEAAPDEIILIIGSLYLVGEIRELFLEGTHQK